MLLIFTRWTFPNAFWKLSTMRIWFWWRTGLNRACFFFTKEINFKFLWRLNVDLLCFGIDNFGRLRRLRIPYDASHVSPVLQQSNERHLFLVFNNETCRIFTIFTKKMCVCRAIHHRTTTSSKQNSLFKHTGTTRWLITRLVACLNGGAGLAVYGRGGG